MELWGIEPQPSRMLSERSTTELQPQVTFKAPIDTMYLSTMKNESTRLITFFKFFAQKLNFFFSKFDIFTQKRIFAQKLSLCEESIARISENLKRFPDPDSGNRVCVLIEIW